MSGVGVRVTVLCEDRSQNTFARDFLERTGFHNREIRTRMAPGGSGAASDWVAKTFPVELQAYRRRKNSQNVALVVLLDADNREVEVRKRWLDQLCRDAGIEPRQDQDCVVYAIPKRNIETWFAYLRGQTVNETATYPRYQEQRECRKDAAKLFLLCQNQESLHSPPPSLATACAEYRRLLAVRRG